MKKLLFTAMALLVFTLPTVFASQDHQYGVPVSAQEAEQVHGACPGTLFLTVTSCTGPCVTWGGGVSVQTLSGGLGNGSLTNFDCGCGTWYDTWIYTDCDGG